VSGYKLLLVPVDELDPDWTGPSEEALVMVGGGTRPLRVGPYEVIADVGVDKQIKMTRLVYEQVEVVD
jgi:hypothetical protein